jgi:hypothetical protein
MEGYFMNKKGGPYTGHLQMTMCLVRDNFSQK